MIECGLGWELHNGDSFAADGISALADKSVDHTICDPPYSEHVEHGQAVSGRRTGQAVIRREAIGVGYMTGGKRNDGRSRSMGVGDMGVGDIATLCAHAVRVTRRWLVFFCAWEQGKDYELGIVAAGGRYVRTCAWEKPDATPQLSGDRPATWGECMIVGHAPAKGKMHWNAGGKRGLYKHGVCRGAERSEHPTQKPLALMREILEDFTDHGDLILDPFSGSGSTGVAARMLGRQFLGWERDSKFFDIAVRRLRGEEASPDVSQPSLFDGVSA